MERALSDAPDGPGAASVIFLALPESDPCIVSERWGIVLELSQKLVAAAQTIAALGLGHLMIISGYRTPEKQQELIDAGGPTATIARSTHTSCPATGADVWLAAVGNTPESDGLKGAVVVAMEAEGLRVGGGGPVAANGLPVDWNHADLGRRVQT